jgi:hypothetical protein
MEQNAVGRIRNSSSNGNEAHMTASDTLYAYEAGLITKAEAAEQALVDRLDDLYQQVGMSAPLGKTSARRVDARVQRSMA